MPCNPYFIFIVAERYICCLALNLLTNGPVSHSLFTYAYTEESTQFLLTTSKQHYVLGVMYLNLSQKILAQFLCSFSQFNETTHGSLHRNSMLIKIQPDATACRYLFTAKPLYMFRVSQHLSSGVLKTVTAAFGIGHNIGTTTSLQRGLIGPRWREVE